MYMCHLLPLFPWLIAVNWWIPSRSFNPPSCLAPILFFKHKWYVVYIGFSSFFFFFFFGLVCGMCKFSGQGSNPRHSSESSRSLAARPLGNSYIGSSVLVCEGLLQSLSAAYFPIHRCTITLLKKIPDLLNHSYIEKCLGFFSNWHYVCVYFWILCSLPLIWFSVVYLDTKAILPFFYFAF